MIPRATATEHGIELSKTEVSQIFTKYMDDMKKTLRPDKQGKKWTYYKSCAQAKMRRDAGHVFTKPRAFTQHIYCGVSQKWKNRLKISIEDVNN